jgi:multiple sugar transport system ATP-binding protein
MMFQNLALYPDKTVFDNIAYPLRERKLPKAEIQTRVTAVAKSLYIDHLLQRKPAKLSGGERQRVALGRAMVRRPRATLMDEPLANLDALLRLEMRVELKHRQKEEGSTLVYVTHDQVEAMSMADRIAVLNRGRLQQCDVPDAIYSLPANRFVATVIGSPPTNFITTDVRLSDGDLLIGHPAFTLRATGAGHPLVAALAEQGALPEKTVVGIRPEDIQVFAARPGSDALPAEVSVIEPLGGETIVDLLVGPDIIKAIVPPAQLLSEGQAVWIKFDSDQIHSTSPASKLPKPATSVAFSGPKMVLIRTVSGSEGIGEAPRMPYRMTLTSRPIQPLWAIKARTLSMSLEMKNIRTINTSRETIKTVSGWIFFSSTD